MSIAKDHKDILNLVEIYKTKLRNYPESAFQETPDTGGWSFSEVYFHIFDASILALDTIKDCINGNGQHRPTPFIVQIILFFGALPPGKKYIAPKRLAERLRKINKSEATELVSQFLSEFAQVYIHIPEADPTIKTPHPRMGYLNAAQWLRFAKIHLSHHLKQLDRIEKRD